MIEVAQAVDLINRFTSPLPSESVDVSESILGRTINQSVQATSPFPSLPLSIMDGYAVRASDCPGELNIVKSVRAGAMSQSTNQSSSTTDRQPNVTLIGPGECHYVTTGAPVLNGADAVCMIEQTEEGSTSDKVRHIFHLLISHLSTHCISLTKVDDCMFYCPLGSYYDFIENRDKYSSDRL